MIAFVDTECYIDYWLCLFSTGEVFEIYPGTDFDRSELASVMHKYTVVTFNGNNYDLPLIEHAIAGANTIELKRLSDAIIVDRIKVWPKDRSIDHIDLIEVLPGVSSLKAYGGKNHTAKLQDLPFDPSESVSGSMRGVLLKYCFNDIVVLEELYNRFKTQVQLRVDMSAEYNIDLRSKSDAQMAESVFKTLVHTDKSAYVPLRFNHSNLYRPDLFDSDYYVQLNNTIAAVDKLPTSTVIGKNTYSIGIGGLHSIETCVRYTNGVICDIDVASYYPSLILNQRINPPRIHDFLSEYDRIYKNRIAFKITKDKRADSLKTLLNGTFGKLNSPYSVFYSPADFLNVTLNGQGALLTLIEMLGGCAIDIISANTDGIVTRCEPYQITKRDAIVKQWESITGLATEYTEYSAIYIRDVNNYIAIKPDGKVKLKGCFAQPEPGPSGWPNPTGQISTTALVEFLKSGTPIEETINNCNDICEFLYVRQCKGGGYYNDNALPPKSASKVSITKTLSSIGIRANNDNMFKLYDAYRDSILSNRDYLGKTVRWYYSTSKGEIRNKSGDLVAGATNCKPMMQLFDSIPNDLDRNRYVEISKSYLNQLGVN